MYQGFALDIAAVMPAAVATGLLTSLCTVQAPNLTYGTSGAPSGTYAVVVGLLNIPCMNAPESVGSMVATEQKSIPQVESKSIRHILLNKYYSQLDGNLNWGSIGWQAIVDGVTYDIYGAERDSQSSQTRLKLVLVSV